MEYLPGGDSTDDLIGNHTLSENGLNSIRLNKC